MESPLWVAVETASTGAWSKQSAALGGNINRDIVPVGFLSPNGRGFAVWAEGANIHAKKVR